MDINPLDFDAEAINALHLNSDRDAGVGALHHTLGLGPTQASPGSHKHNGRDSYRIQLKELKGESIAFTPEGGTNGTQPTYSGDPLITGKYTKWGNLIHFDIKVDFSNILTFGTGRYYLTLPYSAEIDYIFRDGCLHTSIGGTQFHISGHVSANDNKIELSSSDKVASGVQDVDFTSTFPVTLTNTGVFHIAGTYLIKQ